MKFRLLSLVFITGALSFGWAAEHSAVTPTKRSGRHLERHERFNEIVESKKGAVDLVFIGDSITQGWERAGASIWKTFYGHRRAVNLGIGGDRTQHVLWRLENGNLDGISPKVAVVMIGTNNSADDRNTASEMVDGVKAVVGSLREKLPEMKILLLGIFPRGESFNAQRGKILQVNQAIRKWDDGEFVHYLDIGHRFLSDDGHLPKEIMPDYLHLSEAGYQLWATSIEPKLAALLGDDEVLMEESVVAGNWVWAMPGPDGQTVESNLTLDVKGNKVSGAFRFPGGRVLPLTEGRVEGANVEFRIVRDRPNGGSMVYRMTGSVTEDTLEGEVATEFQGQPMTQTWKATRSR